MMVVAVMMFIEVMNDDRARSSGILILIVVGTCPRPCVAAKPRAAKPPCEPRPARAAKPSYVAAKPRARV